MTANLRAACALLVACAYGLPLTVAVSSQAGHEVDHLWGGLRGAEVATAPTSSEAEPGGFVHAHGDLGAHTHSGGLGKLLLAAHQTDERQDETAVVALELVGHVPPGGASAPALAGVVTRRVDTPASTWVDVSLRPPLPPPRA